VGRGPPGTPGGVPARGTYNANPDNGRNTGVVTIDTGTLTAVWGQLKTPTARWTASAGTWSGDGPGLAFSSFARRPRDDYSTPVKARRDPGDYQHRLDHATGTPPGPSRPISTNVTQHGLTVNTFTRISPITANTVGRWRGGVRLRPRSGSGDHYHAGDDQYDQFSGHNHPATRRQLSATLIRGRKPGVSRSQTER
jgi:hypothetical protein